MNRMYMSHFVSAFLILTFFSGISLAQAQRIVPDSPDLALLRAFKDARPIEAPRPAIAGGSLPQMPGAVPAVEPAAQANGEAGWTLLAGEALIDGNWEIITVRSNGTDSRRATAHGATDVRPALNRDGSRIVFTSNRTGNTDLFAVNADGSNLLQLTGSQKSDNFARWFPSGDRIVFASNRDDNWEIYVMNSDGSGQTRLTADAATDLDPAVSPDGGTIAWVRQNQRAGHVWLMNSDGTNQRPLGEVCDYLQNLHWMSNEYLLADCDTDGDVMNEVVAFPAGALGRTTIYDTNQPLAEALAGGTLARTDVSGFYPPVYSSIQLRYAVENQTVVLKDLWSQVVGTIGTPVTNLSATALWSWVKTDWLAPVSWLANTTPVVYGNFSGSITPPLRPDGFDYGSSGLARFRIDYRRNGGEWMVGGGLLPGEDPSGKVSFHVDLGDQVDLRSAVTDVAGNEENVASKQPVSFRYFRSQLMGRVTDRRGIPLADVAYFSPELAATAGKSGIGGNIEGDVVRENRIGITFTHPAFVTSSAWIDVPSVHQSVQTAFSVSLHPTDDVLIDGGFEKETLVDWSSDPISGTRMWQGSAYAGWQHLYLGQPAAYLANTSVLAGGDVWLGTISQADVAYDDAGAVHILRDSIYQRCSGGVCSPVENIYGARKVTTPERGVLVRARAGRVFAVRKESSGASQTLRLFERTGGGWIDEVFATGQFDTGPDMQIGGDGTVYLAWREAVIEAPSTLLRAALRVREKKAGVWSTAKTVYVAPEYGSIGNIRVRLDANDVPHIFFGADKLYEVLRETNGSWSGPIVVDDTQLGGFDFVFDSANVLHGIYMRTALFYTSRTAGVWSDYQFVAENATLPEISPRIGLLANDQPAIIRGDDRLYLHQSNDKWSGPHYTGAPSVGPVLSALLATGPQGQLALLTLEDVEDSYDPLVLYELVGRPFPESSQSTRLVKRFEIPSRLHNPYLYFVAAFESEDRRKNQDRFVVEIDDGAAVSRTLTVGNPTGWQEYAVSLLPWQGREITLTLAVDAVADNVFAWARLDAIQIASWSTPIIREIAVSSSASTRTVIPIGVSATVNITGENFLPGASVSFGPFAASDVQLMSDKRMVAQTPTGLPAGIYSVIVTNPGGVSAIQPNAVAVGEQAYLPAVGR